MRAFAVLSTTLLAACTATMNEPRILVSPYLAVYRLRGETSLQSPPPLFGSPAEDNHAQLLGVFGQDHHREDVGVRADIGDGFGGFRADYYRLDMGPARGAALADDWGGLAAGERAQAKATMDELRLGYVEPVLHQRVLWRDHALTFQAGAGGVLAYRKLELRGESRLDEVSSRQDLRVDGDLIYGAVRGRVTWRDFGLDVEYAYSPEIALRGDWHGSQHDLEVRGTYTLPWRDVTFFGGFRRGELDAEGRFQGLDYRADLVLDGWQFGVTVTF